VIGSVARIAPFFISKPLIDLSEFLAQTVKAWHAIEIAILRCLFEKVLHRLVMPADCIGAAGQVKLGF
jgi:hypothetical protein